MIRPHWLFLGLAFISSGHAGGVFWTDRGAGQLKRMSFDGTNLHSLTLSGAVTSAGSNIRGLAVDAVSNRVFWADNGADRLLRANFDGSASIVLHTISGGNSFPADVRLDLSRGHFYWCDQLRNRIQRSALDGTGVISVITNAATTGPYFLEIDLAAGKIYWGDFDAGSIFRADLDGSARETLLTGNNNTRGVRLDAGAGLLYWVNRDDKKIHRCPLSAFAGGTIPLTHPAVQTLYTNLDTPHGLVLDIPARKLYWADTGTNPGNGQGGQAVSRGDFDGATPMEILATGAEPWDVDLDLRCASYAEWRARCFRRDALPAQAGPDANPDADPFSNVLEYAFDLSPLHADAKGAPEIFLSGGPSLDSTHALLKFRRRATARDLDYVIQTSTNLMDWTVAGSPSVLELQTRPLENGLEEVTARMVEPVSARPNLFVRLRVILSPD